MSYFLPKGDYVMMYVILCISIHMMLIVLFVYFSVPIFLYKCSLFLGLEIMSLGW